MWKKWLVLFLSPIPFLHHLVSLEEKKDPKDSYKELFLLSQKIGLFSSIHTLLSWDQETYMPKEGIHLKAKQKELLSSVVHKEHTSDTYKNLLERFISLESGKFLVTTLQDEEKANIREWRKDFLQEAKLPSHFVEKFSTITSEAIEQWKKAKSQNSFILFEPSLQKIVDLCIEKASYLGYKKHPYDALLDLYEPDMTCEKLDLLFSQLKPKLISLLQKIKEKPAIDNSFLFQHYPRELQRKIASDLMKSMTLDPNVCRLDESVHPFTEGLYAKDVRITTHIEENCLSSSFFAVLHESGHALYELGLPEESFGTPMGQAASMGIHESQSRFWETLIGKNFNFWSYFYPTLQQTFPEQLKKISFDTFYQGINKIEPSLIRIKSDEISYCLHIIVRYEIEKALMEKTLNVEDIPKTWNQKMQDYLGITPPSDALGCLQDIHWSLGALGYFPSYALGNLYAAQFFEQLKKEHTDWQERLKTGDFTFICDWLHKKIHQYGRFYTPEDLIEKVTEKKLSEEAYIRYLTEKFSTIYEL